MTSALLPQLLQTEAYRDGLGITSEGQFSSGDGECVPDRSQNTTDESFEEEPDVGRQAGGSPMHRDRLGPQKRGIKEGCYSVVLCRSCCAFTVRS